MTDTELIDWIDRHDCAELILTPDATGKTGNHIYFGALMGGFGSGLSIREAVTEFISKERGPRSAAGKE